MNRPTRELWSVPGPADHDYFRALYSTIDESPFALRYAGSLAQVPAETSHAVIHANWLWTSAYRTLTGARRFVAENIAQLDRLIDQGCRLIWSIHEPLSHDCLQLAEEHELNRLLLERASIVHILSIDTPERCLPDLELPKDRLLYNPVPLLEDSYVTDGDEQASELRALLEIPANTDLVVGLGVRRRYKEFESIARSVMRRNQSGEPAPGLFVNAGKSLPFPVDRTSQRVQRLGAVAVDAHLPSWLFQGLAAAGAAVALPYSVGLNSGVLAGAIGVGTPAVVSDQLRLSEFEALSDLTFFDADGGHAAIDGAVDHALQPSTAVEWQGHRERYRQLNDPAAISAEFLEAAAGVQDTPAPAVRSSPRFHESDDGASRRRLAAARFFPAERAYVVAMRKIAELAQSELDSQTEFDALVCWFESLGYVGESDAGIERILRLGLDLGAERAALSALHRAIDLDTSIAQLITTAAAPLAHEHRLAVGLADIESRVGEQHVRHPLAEKVESRLLELSERPTLHE